MAGFGNYDELDENRLTFSGIKENYIRSKEESTGICHFLTLFAAVFFKSIFLTIGWATAMIVPVAMIVIGTKYMDQCTAERNLPVALVVGGSFILLVYAISMVRKYYEGCEENTFCLCLRVLIYSFLFIWLIVGSVLTYRNYKHNFDDILCSNTLYSFSFWLLNTFYIIVSFIFTINLCAMCFYVISNAIGNCCH